MDYCLFKANCCVLKMDTKSMYEDKYRCCFTCPKKDKCDVACKDRDKSKSKCPFLTIKEDVIQFWHLDKILDNESKKQIDKKEIAKTAAQEEKKPKVVEVKVEDEKIKSKKNPTRTLKPKKEKLPATVKELAALLKVPYQKVNYLVKTKGLTFEETYNKLKGDKS